MIPIDRNETSCQIKIDKRNLYRRDFRLSRKRSIFSPKTKNIFLTLCCSFLLFSTVLAGFHGIPLLKQYQTLSMQMGRVANGRFHQLLSASLTIRPGMDTQNLQLLKRLTTLGYQPGNMNNLAAGEYAHSQNRVVIKPKQNTSSTNNLIVIDLSDSKLELISEVKSGKIIAELQLGRIKLTSFLDTIWEVRYPNQYTDYPPALLQAVLSAEDNNFYTHHGIDLRSILRAAWVNLRQGRIVQGGSTITQQLVKTLIQRKGRGFKDKIYEGMLAMVLELRYSKEEILTAYLNTLYLGQVGPFALQGMGAAAKHLLGTEVEDLTIRQAAMLAGIIRAPNSLSPQAHPEKAAIRAQTVLEQMFRNGYLEQPLLISTQIHDVIKSHENKLLSLTWYYQQLEKELAGINLYRHQKNKGHGMEIQLGLDPFMQQDAQQALNRHLSRLESKKHSVQGSLQGAVVSIDPGTGSIRSLVGGRNFLNSQFNRATSARRQIGSLVKPFVYLAAMNSTKDDAMPLTQASRVSDTPLRIKVGSSFWSPKNFDRRYKGRISLRDALADSRNIPAVRLGLKAGVAATGKFITKLGISIQSATGPALFLGAVDSSPLKMAAAYGALANGGRFITPTVIEKIIWQKQILYRHPPGKRVIAEQDAYVMTDMLREVVAHGTAKSAKKYGLSAPVAGKTGTSNNLRDGWFAGYSPTLTTVVWVGRDNNHKMGLTGAASSLPIWAELMAKYGGQRDDIFAIPDGIEFKSRGSQSTTCRMAFIRGTAPSTSVYQQVVTIREQLHKQRQNQRQKQPNLATTTGQRYKYF